MVKKRRREVSSEGLRESFETLAQLLVAGGELGTALLEELDGAGGVARQVVDVAVGRLHLGQDAFQFGDGLSNLIWPTSSTVFAYLAMANLRYDKYLKIAVPLFAVLSVLAVIFVAGAQLVGFGPF